MKSLLGKAQLTPFPSGIDPRVAIALLLSQMIGGAGAGHANSLLTDLWSWYRNNGTDWSGNGRHMESTPGDPGTTTGIGGESDAAIDGDGINWWQLSGVEAFSGPAFSLSGWARATSEHTIVYCHELFNFVRAGIGLEPAVAKGLVNGTAVTWDDAGVTDGEFHHLVLTFDDGTARLYVDGELRATQSPLSMEYDISVIRIAGTTSPGSATQFVGIWSRALSADEVSHLFNGGDGYDPTL